VAASRQQEQGSRPRDTTKCVTRCQNGVNCKVCVFRCYDIQSCAASNRRTVCSKSSLPELALLLSARSPVSPAAFFSRQKWREMRNTRFSLLWHSVARRKQQEKHSRYLSVLLDIRPFRSTPSLLSTKPEFFSL